MFTRRLKMADTPEKKIAVRLTYGFLTKGYLQDYFWWELVVLTRRILCIIAVVSTKNPSEQTVYLMLIILIFTGLHIIHSPLNLGFLNCYEFVNLCCLALSCFATLVAYGSPDNDLLVETAAILFLTAQVLFMLSTLFVFYTLFRTIKSKWAASSILASAMPAMMFKSVVADTVSSVA